MKTINGIPLVWDDEGDKKMLGALFAMGNGASELDALKTNAPAYQSPFGAGSLFAEKKTEDEKFYKVQKRKV
jgi:hypothetical protein